MLGLLLRRHVKRWRVPELELSEGVDHALHRSSGVVDELTFSFHVIGLTDCLRILGLARGLRLSSVALLLHRHQVGQAYRREVLSGRTRRSAENNRVTSRVPLLR